MTHATTAAPRIKPWIALALPPLTWFVFEVGLAGALRLSCEAVGGGLGVAWGCASLVVCAGAMRLAWPLARTANDRSSPHWVARVALFAAGFFALAIAFQTISTLIVPACVR